MRSARRWATATPTCPRSIARATEGVERGPARVGLVILVLVRLGVQVLAADRAEAGAVRVVEDLVRQGERERVAGPGGQVEHVVGDVRGTELLVAAGVRRLVLARADRQLEHGVGEAAEAGAVQLYPEGELEHAAGRRLRHRQLGGHEGGHGQVLLAAEHERGELHLDLVAELLAIAQPGVAEVERRHAVTVARGSRHASVTVPGTWGDSREEVVTLPRRGLAPVSKSRRSWHASVTVPGTGTWLRRPCGTARPGAAPAGGPAPAPPVRGCTGAATRPSARRPDAVRGGRRAARSRRGARAPRRAPCPRRARPRTPSRGRP